MPNYTPTPDTRAVVADIAVDIEAAAMRAHEQLNGLHPYSMSSSQFKLAGLALQIASLSQQMRAEIASSYPLRSAGGGPPFVKIGRRIAYPVVGVRIWALQRMTQGGHS